MKLMNTTDRDTITLDEEHPYLGLSPFEETHKDYFFGRDREIKELTRLIENNILTVVFGKSGMGKTSLLRAGLIPWIRKNYYLPIYIRIDFNNPIPPLRQVKAIIREKIQDMDPEAQAINDNDTLWEYFSFAKILNGFVFPLLVFDQFEEIFTTPEKGSPDIDAFVTEITDLIENLVPEAVEDRCEKQGKPVPFPAHAPNFRVIFSLREEYLPQLESFAEYLPSVMLNRCRISYMKGEDAVKAVMGPAKKIISDRAVAEKIIEQIPPDKLMDYIPYNPGADSWKTWNIEPFLLSLFCYQANEKRLKKKEKVISLELIRDLSAVEIIRNHYEEKISTFPAPVRNAVEDRLVNSLGYRTLKEINSLKESSYHITDKNIEALVNCRILRKESHGGVDYVELSHDVLAPIIKEIRDKRIEKKKRKQIFGAIAAIVLLILAVLTAYILVQQERIKSEKKRAFEETQRALDEQKKAEQEKLKRQAYEWAAYSIDLQKRDRDLSFRLAEQAYRQAKDDPVSRRAVLSVFYEGGFYKELLAYKDSEFSRIESQKSDFFAAFSPDGKKILTVTSNAAILWNWDGQQPYKDKRVFQVVGTEFRQSAAFSPDGNFIIICTKAANRLEIRNLETAESRSLTFAGEIGSVAFSPDKKDLTFIAVFRDNTFRQFDLTGKLRHTFTGHTDEVISALFSQDGKSIISAAWDNSVRIWDLNGTIIASKKFDNDDAMITTASLSPDGQHVVTGSADGSVQLWDFNLTEAHTLGKHERAVTTAVFSPDGQYILSGGEDGAVRLLTRNNFLVMEFKEWKDIIRTASFSPDRKYILIAPGSGPADRRPIDPGTIIDIVNRKGKVRQLTDADRLSYNLPQS